MTDFQLERIEQLKNNDSKECIYSVWSTIFSETGCFDEMDCFGYFMDYENAYALGKTLEASFNIQVSHILDAPSKKGYPEPLDDDEQKFTPNHSIATIRFDAAGEVKMLLLRD